MNTDPSSYATYCYAPPARHSGPRYIKPRDPARRPLNDKAIGALPANPFVGLPAYIYGSRSKYTPAPRQQHTILA